MDVRRVEGSDWELVRDLRLQALADAPQAFGSTYEREAAYGEDVWIGRLGTLANTTIVCECSGTPCGLVTLVRDERDHRTGWLVGMWVAPSFRGSGAADRLVASVLEWAGQHGISTVRLHVADGNARAERVYRRHGFSRTGNVSAGQREGLIEVEMQRTTPPPPS